MPRYYRADQIVVQLPHYMKIAGDKIAKLLSTCTGSLPTLQRRQTLCKVMGIVFDLASNRSYAVEGCGPYKCKRLAEVVILACLSSRILVPHMTQDDLNALGGCWPLPDGSRRGLKMILPGLTAKTRQQQGLKALSLVLGSGGNGKTIPPLTIIRNALLMERAQEWRS